MHFPNWDGHVAFHVHLSPHNPVVMAGPCMLESLDLGLRVGEFLKNACQSRGLPYVFKSSYDKANRTSTTSERGPGLSRGLEWLSHVRETLQVPILTDVHSVAEVHAAASVADILQIPAFLFQQKELLEAAAHTGKCIQIKKGQWAQGEDMLSVADFLSKCGNSKCILVERGTLFGYNNLVVDFRNLEVMKRNGHAVVYDATHAVQMPGAKEGRSSGQRHMVLPLTRAALGVGVHGVFLEVHPDPAQALSDADTQLDFSLATQLLDLIKF